jgi:hypothetical protein
MAPTLPSAGKVNRRPHKARVRDAYGTRIKAMARRGHGAEAIARRLALYPGTVRSILSHFGLFKPRGIHPLKEKVRPLVKGGMTLHEAAQVLRVSPAVAKYHHKEAGGKVVRPASRLSGSPRRAAELSKHLEAYRERTEMTLKAVAACCGLTPSVLSLWAAGREVPSDYTSGHFSSKQARCNQLLSSLFERKMSLLS